MAGAPRIISKTGTPKDEVGAAVVCGGEVKITVQKAPVATTKAPANSTRLRFEGIILRAVSKA